MINLKYRFLLGVANLYDWGSQTLYGFRLADSDFESVAKDADYNTTSAITITPGIPYQVSPFAIGYGYNANHTRVYTAPNSRILTFPEGVVYMRFSLLKSDTEQDVKVFTIEGDYDHVAHPIYKSDLAIDYEKETNQEFFRRKLSSKLDFINEDYDYIMAAGFDMQVNVKLLYSKDLGTTWEPLWIGKFFRTDCTVDVDNKLITVTPEVNDSYGPVLAGMEKEFNLVEMGLPTVPVNYWRRPLLQVYIPGEDVVTNYVGNVYFEQDSENITNYSDLISKYKFALASIDMQIEVLSTGGIPESYAGIYRGRGTYLANTNSWQATLYKDGSTATRLVYKSAGITANNEDFEFYVGTSTNPIYKRNQGGQFGNNRSLALQTQSGGTGTMTIEIVYGLMFMRYLLDVSSFQSQEIFPIPTEDIVTNERRYKYVTRFTGNIGAISGREQADPTKWGRSDRGTYYLPPNDTAYFVPISQNRWGKSSYWLQTTLIDNTYEAAGRRQITLADAFPISSVIQKLLQQIAPGITHVNSAAYSQFLYGATNPLGAQKINLFLTPITNMTKGEYQTAAQKGNITFQQVMNMLRDAFGCYWYIENNMFKIEHLSYFEKGGTYTGARQVGIFLKNLRSFPTRKSWGFGTNSYTFDKINMPQQYRFQWADETTEIFDGYPINIHSNYVQEGKIEEKNISQFTTNVDYMVLNPGEISKDGFALLGATQVSNTVFNIDVVPLVVDGFTYYVQNAYLTMAYLQPNFLTYGMPAKNLEVNNEPTTAKSIARNKKQTLNIPVTWDINPTNLINTALGDGEIEKLSVNLSSLISKTTLKYDTE